MTGSCTVEDGTMTMVALLATLAFAQEAAPAGAVKPGEVTSPPRFKPGKGLSFASDDDQFALTLRLRAQYLYTMLDDPEEDATLHGFQIRRARLVFGGHVFGEHNKYKTEFAFSPRDENTGDDGPALTALLDWYAEFDHLRDLNVRIGQYKVPFNRQRVISSGDLQMVDRSISQGEFNVDRDVGLHVFSKDLGGLDLFRYYAGAWVNQGRDAHEAAALHPMLIGRVEILPLGGFDDYTEADLERSEEPGLSVGAAYAWLDEARNSRGILGSGFADGGTADMQVATVDVMFKYAGLSLFGEGYLRRGERHAGDAVDEAGEPVPTEPLSEGNGWFVQGGYVLPAAPVEIAARYSDIRPTGTDSGLSEAHEAGVALSYYPGEHSLKLQGDYFRVWGEDGAGEGANQVRVQLQMAY